MYRNVLKIPRLILALVSILTIGFAATSILSYSTAKQYVVESQINQTLPLISDNIYSLIEEEIIDPINISSLMANDSFLIDWVDSGETDLEAITVYLSTIKEEYGFFSAFYISEISSNYYYYDGILKQISTEDAHDVWYYQFKELNVPYDLDVDNDEATDDTLTVFINHRLEGADGTFLGVTGVGLKLTDIGKTLEEYGERFDHQIYMVDSNGLIQVHSDASMVETARIDQLDGIKEISTELLASAEGTNFFEYRDPSGAKTIASRYLDEFDWFLIVEADQDAALQQARQLLIQNVLIGLGVTIATTMLVVWVVNNYNQRLIHLATHDELTELYNRRAFQDMMIRELGISRRYHQAISLLMIDVDEFKSVNDQFGHQIGDRMLNEIAQTLKNNLREIDILGRWGGEEFVVLLPNTSKKHAQAAADRLRQGVEDLILKTEKGKISRTVSIGIATQENGENDLMVLISHADEALRHAKLKGKNQTEVY
jgi:diguanylate cyclase (GGDEF)-like protein